MSFASDVEKWVSKVNKALDATMRETVIEAHNGVKAHTPVDTGELRQSWGISDNDPRWGKAVSIWTDKEYAPVVEYGLYPGVGAKTTKVGSGIFSVQAPQGMVRITAKEMKSVAEKIWSQHAP
ncbi:HK97 gp10 family phage protein [Cardiobacteriaceae bacterium TAE3-ERU3]|nr:HK97 gp10 family phage protein [Cardiobacteriaceae bacterium TAE3-ERU3]